MALFWLESHNKQLQSESWSFQVKDMEKERTVWCYPVPNCSGLVAGWARPDITFDVSNDVSNVARFCFKPTKEHWVAVKWGARRALWIMDYCMQRMMKVMTNQIFWCWLGCMVMWMTQSPYLFMVSGAPISWKNKKQTCGTPSTAKAEYVASTQEVT